MVDGTRGYGNDYPVARQTLTTDETRAAARTLLTKQPTATEHIDADTDLTVDPEHIPPSLRSIRLWLLLVAFYADEEKIAVVGHLCFGIDASEITREVFGRQSVDWSTIEQAPWHVQQALVMLILAEIRDARAASRVVSSMRKMHRGRLS